MPRASLITMLAALAIIAGAGQAAWSQETLKVAIPQRGAWDAGVDGVDIGPEPSQGGHHAARIQAPAEKGRLATSCTS